MFVEVGDTMTHRVAQFFPLLNDHVQAMIVSLYIYEENPQLEIIFKLVKIYIDFAIWRILGDPSKAFGYSSVRSRKM